MEIKKFVYHKDGNMWIGRLEEYLDYTRLISAGTRTARCLVAYDTER
jgi:hypothetical protein